MNLAAVRRSIGVIRYLKAHPSARFRDLRQELAPVSSTALAMLLQTLVEEGELQHSGRSYTLSPGAASAAGSPQGIYSLPESLAKPVGELLDEAAKTTVHSCALFGWVGASTFKILATHDTPDWRFSPIGYEWPLLPFHAVAQLFLAYAPEIVARDSFYRWSPFVHVNESFESYASFAKRIAEIRKKGYAVEYRGERPEIMRIAVPIWFRRKPDPRYAVGMVANAVYLLELQKCISALVDVASKLAKVLEGSVPAFHYKTPIPDRVDAGPYSKRIVPDWTPPPEIASSSG